MAHFLGRNDSVKVFDGSKYPAVRRNESVIDNFHGTKIADPYRWLEDPNSDETKQFAAVENIISKTFIESSDKYQKINKKLSALWNYPKYFVPKRIGKYYFSFKNTGLQNQKLVNNNV